MDTSYRDHNYAATAQLRSFVEKLDTADFDRPLGGGWSVKAGLAHMAFWDRLAASLLEEWHRTGTGPLVFHEEDLHLNRVCLPDWLAVPPAHAAREVIEAATLVDQRAAQIDGHLHAAIVAAGESWIMLLYRHRYEHLVHMGQAVPDLPELI